MLNKINKIRKLSKSFLIFKQTFKTLWKSKLQLVILMLLSVLCTVVITGSWVSFRALQTGKEFMSLNDTKFDAVMPYPINTDYYQIASQSFSLSLGRLYAKNGNSQANNALYYDDTRIGREIKAIKIDDILINYIKKPDQTITRVGMFKWIDNNQPLKFDITNPNVKASIYGQLLLKAQNTNNYNLKKCYEDSAKNLYDSIFKVTTLQDITKALIDFIDSWLSQNNTQDVKTDKQMTEILLKKINYQNELNDAQNYTLSSEENVLINDNNLWKKIVHSTELDPRASKNSIGMNGQWTKITRRFKDIDVENAIKQNFNFYYDSNNQSNIIKDKYEDHLKNIFSYHIIRAIAALQKRDLRIINQFTATAGVNEKTKKPTNIKVINLGFKQLYNNVDLKIFEGIAPKDRNHVVISPQYARIHGIKPGNNIFINNYKFLVTGIGGDAFNIFPKTNDIDSLPNNSNEYIAYVLPDTYFNQKWYDLADRTENSIAYFIPWKHTNFKEFRVDYFNDYFQGTIFQFNGGADQHQNEYNEYLRDKYVFKCTDKVGPNYNFRLINNKIVTNKDSEFIIYNFGRIIFDHTVSSFFYIIIFAVSFLTIIVTFITSLIIKKSIQNAKIALGILKATGYKASQIAISYIIYPLLVFLIAIPLGWTIGIISQYYFSWIFNQLFSLPYNIFNFDFISFLISTIVIIGTVLLTSLITSFVKLTRNTIFLIKKDSNINIGKNKYSFIKKLFKKNFKAKFIISITKTSWKKVIITASVISLATIAFTTSLSFPAIMNKMSTDYFKSQNYENYYKYQTPMPNMPLSKYGLSSWNNLDNANKEKYYPVGGVSPFTSQIIISDDQNNKKIAWYNPLEYKKDNNIDNFNKIIKFYPAATDKEMSEIKSNMQQVLHSGTYSPLVPELLTWNLSWLGGRAFSNKMIKDLTEEDNSLNKNFSNGIIQFASLIVKKLLPIDKQKLSNEDNLDKIVQSILPGYVRQILDQINRNSMGKIDAYSEFSIGHNSIAINPNYEPAIGGPQEELATHVNLATLNTNTGVNFIDVLGINPDTKMLKINSSITKQLKFNFQQKIIPIVVNHAFKAQYNLKEGAQLEAYPVIKTLYYLSNKGKYVPLPKKSWYYGINPNNHNNNNIWSKTANKWNYHNSRKIENTQYKETYGYDYNGDYDSAGKQIFYKHPEEWNNVNNIWLKLPVDISKGALEGSIRDAENNNVNFKLGNISTDNGWIKPFSFEFTENYKGYASDPLAIIEKKLPQWYGGMIDKKILVAKNNINKATLKDDVIKNMPSWWTNIIGEKNPVHSYKIIGTQDSYDKPRAFIDQKWANKVLGYADNNHHPKTLGGLFQWFNAKLSAADNIYDMIARRSLKYFSDDYTVYGSTRVQTNDSHSVVESFEQLAQKRKILKKMSELSFLVSIVFILITIICSILIVIMITDAFTSQFLQFMSQMKSEGYTSWEINSITLGIFSPWVFIGYLFGSSAGYLLIIIIFKLITSITSVVFPFVFIWWIIPVSFFLIANVYIITFVINNSKINKLNLVQNLQIKH